MRNLLHVLTGRGFLCEQVSGKISSPALASADTDAMRTEATPFTALVAGSSVPETAKRRLGLKARPVLLLLRPFPIVAS